MSAGETQTHQAQPATGDDGIPEAVPATVPASYYNSPGSNIFHPSFSPTAIKTGMQTYKEAINAILVKDDVQEFPDDKAPGGKRTFIRKAGWNKLALYFGVDTGTSASQYAKMEDGAFAWKVEAYARKGGRRVARSALCSSAEKEYMAAGKTSGRMAADVYATAETRAIGRACAAFFGTGDVSAEEIAGSTLSDLKAQPHTASAAATSSTSNRKPNKKKEEKDPEPGDPPTKQQIGFLRNHHKYTGQVPATYQQMRELLQELNAKEAAAASQGK